MMPKWETLKQQFVIKNRWINLRQDTCRLPDGTVIDDYYVLDENDVGSVFALTSRLELILVEQYKHGIADVCLELPAGFFDDPAGEPREEARREFMEETGYDAPEFQYVGKVAQSPTRMSNYIYLFVALNAYARGPQKLDPAENITVRLMPMPEVFERIATGEINAVATVAGIYLAWNALQQAGAV